MKISIFILFKNECENLVRTHVDGEFAVFKVNVADFLLIHLGFDYALNREQSGNLKRESVAADVPDTDCCAVAGFQPA